LYILDNAFRFRDIQCVDMKLIHTNFYHGNYRDVRITKSQCNMNIVM
jgi:hypothetical protein